VLTAQAFGQYRCGDGLIYLCHSSTATKLHSAFISSLGRTGLHHITSALGILTLGLWAIVFGQKRREPGCWSDFAIFGFVVALGDQGMLYPWLLKFCPALGFMRYPIKFAFLTVFAVPLLAAFTIAWF